MRDSDGWNCTSQEQTWEVRLPCVICRCKSVFEETPGHDLLLEPIGQTCECWGWGKNVTARKERRTNSSWKFTRINGENKIPKTEHATHHISNNLLLTEPVANTFFWEYQDLIFRFKVRFESVIYSFLSFNLPLECYSVTHFFLFLLNLQCRLIFQQTWMRLFSSK